jgi:hypothetical protein
MPEYTITNADNGWVISWWEENSEGDNIKHYMVFEYPDSDDTGRKDPQSLIDLLYFVKENVCGQFYSKHKDKNVVIKYEGEEE